MRVLTSLALLFTSWLLSLNSLKGEVLDQTCYTGRGVNYRGTVDKTRSGRTCQSWSVQTPHSHPWTPENLPCSGLENNNYCRNPDGGNIKPWCFTTDPQQRTEFCEIPQCVGLPQPEPFVPELSCFTLCGQNYRGAVDTTASGRRCQSWSVQTPHSHTATPERYPHTGLENNNYCRNPDRSRKPWCYTTDPQELFEYCEIPRCVPVVDQTCYTGRGVNYRGTVDKTTSGRTCQSWSVQTPHRHTRTPEIRPCGGLENNNYCRNPDGNVKPWCFTTDPQERYEFCEIPQCVGQPEPFVPELSCFTLCGRNYRGAVATTTSGRPCQSWSVQTPHSHSWTPENYPHTGLENNNYCRNPAGAMKPWCWTTDPQERFEFCEIPRCVPVTTTSTLSTTQDGPKNVLLAVDPPGDVVKGSSVTLTCSASGSHPPIQAYILFKDNTAVAQKNTMSISNVQPSDSGTYHCEAFNDIASVDSPPVTVDVHYPPEIPSVSVSPLGGVVEGSTVTLSCSSEANPPVSRYTWYKDRRSISTGHQLVRNNVSPTDSGQYFCLVRNTLGSQRSSLHSLDVRPPLRRNHCVPPEFYRRNSIMIGTQKIMYTPKAKVYYECMVGYTSTGGRPDVTCVNGKWTPLTLTCEGVTTSKIPIKDLFGQCGRHTDQTGITLTVLEGTLSRPGEHPWQVSLQRREKGSSDPFFHQCGGVLIASCWVLTAAHCINSSMDMQVVVGGVDNGRHEESDQVIAVERDFIHADFKKSTASNDIALLQLSFTNGAFCANGTSYVKTACLPNKIFPDGKQCAISGWGKTKDANQPHRMSHGDVTLMSKQRCADVYGALRVDNTMICAEDTLGKVNFCTGDSGGPLICKDNGVHYIAGLVSWVNGSCSGQAPGVYANVHRFVQWISGCVAHDGSPCRTQSVSDTHDYDY